MTLIRGAPYFPVTDVAATAAQYQKVFGFKAEYSAGDPPEFAIVTRDGLSIMLRRVAADTHIVPNEKQAGSWDVFFWVTDVQALFDEVHANGAAIVYGPIIQESYRMKEFAVRDQNGYILGFGQEWH